MSEPLIRLSKIMSERGICSRREADLYIESGDVLVNGQVVDTLGARISPDAEIELRAYAKKKQGKKATIILNKPLGYVSTQPESGYSPAIDLVTAENQYQVEKGPKFDPYHRKKLAVAGRLDIDSKGLLILTQDGVIVKKIIGENAEMEKEYLVRVEGVINPEKIKQLRFGLSLDEKELKSASVELLEEGLLKFILTEGKKRQIRRMCELVDLKVVGLKRVRIGPIKLGQLPEGMWCYIDKELFDN
ncbi:pseudouridine synthase [Chlamydiales bacterium]|nr:pseudouridine synthase [Chlamydiales bacterium]